MRFGTWRGTLLALAAALGLGLGSSGSAHADGQLIQHTIPRSVVAYDFTTGRQYMAPPIPYGHYAKDYIGDLDKAMGCVSCRLHSLVGGGGAGHGLFHHGQGDGDCGSADAWARRRIGVRCHRMWRRKRLQAHGPSRRLSRVRVHPDAVHRARRRSSRRRRRSAASRAARSVRSIPTWARWRPQSLRTLRRRGSRLRRGHGHGERKRLPILRRQGLWSLHGRGARGLGANLHSKLASLAAAVGIGRPKTSWFVGPGGPVPLTPGYVPYIVTTRSPREFFAFAPMNPYDR